MSPLRTPPGERSTPAAGLETPQKTVLNAKTNAEPELEPPAA
jgi:hypothetical protein